MNKINVVSLFSGGGGLDLGFKQEGFNIVWAIDFNKDAANTYRENIGDHIICGDITKVDMNTIPTCDLVIGGPPCQSFSLAGKRQSDDLRGQLIWKYLEIINHLKPKAFLFENVTGLLSAKNHKKELILPQLLKKFSEIGYNVQYKVIDATEFGVPQHRKRVIVVGTKEGIVFEFPMGEYGSKRPLVSAKDALEDLPSAMTENTTYKSAPQNDYQEIMRKNASDIVTEQQKPTMSKLDEYIVAHVKPGGNYMDIPKDVDSKRIRRLQESGGHTTCYGRLSADKPSYTINTYFNRPNVGCNIHYREDRLITVREALRLQSFPDNYKLCATSKQAKNLIVGNAVPPLVAKAFAKAMKGALNGGDK
jgi:DNA (cytosine-5)-methyltransferase 1